MAAAATTPASITAEPTATVSGRRPNAWSTKTASPAALGSRPASSAKPNAVVPARTAATRNATGARIPALPATSPVSA